MLGKKSFFTKEVGFICLLLIVLTVTIYFQVKDFSFINYDDQLYVTQNYRVRNGLTFENIKWAFTTFHASNYHPLTWLSHMLDVSMFGMDAGRHHAVNLFFHLANVIILFFVLRLMTGSVWRSGWVALLFGVHPLHVESVAWIAERKDVLSTFWGLLAVMGYYWYVRKPNLRRYVSVFVFSAFSLLSKPMLVTLPFLLLLLDFWPLNRLKLWQSEHHEAEQDKSNLMRLVLEKIPIMLLAVVASVLTLLAQKNSMPTNTSTLTFDLRAMNALFSYMEYLRRMVWPSGLAVLYPVLHGVTPWKIIVSGGSLLLITYFVLLNLRARPYMAVGWFWYLGTLVPVIGLVQVGVQAMADRYTYIPLIGIFIAAVWSVAEFASRQRYARQIFIRLILAALIIPYTFIAWKQTAYWRDNITLFARTLAVTQNNYVAENNYGVSLAEVGRLDEAITHFKKALLIDPNNQEVRRNLDQALRIKHRSRK